MRVLYDGWPLVYHPGSPAALHLLALLAYHPPQAEAVVALPGKLPFTLPGSPWLRLHPTENNGRAHLGWEQGTLARLAQAVEAQLVHQVGGSPALFGRAIMLVSPAGFGPPPLYVQTAGHGAGLSRRLSEAMAQGGLSRLAGLLWPEDLASPSRELPLVPLPPVVYLPEPEPGSSGNNGSAGPNGHEVELPETYILYQGPQQLPDLRRVLESWSWAAGSIGETHPLLLAGLSEPVRQALPALAQEYNLEETVRALPPLPPSTLIKVYRKSSVVFHPAPLSPWGGPLRLALICGVPVVALENPMSDAMAGPAAYLVRSGSPAETHRALGAALLTVVVEESVGESLAQAARQRSAPWQQPEQVRAFQARLLAAYENSL